MDITLTHDKCLPFNFHVEKQLYLLSLRDTEHVKYDKSTRVVEINAEIVIIK